MKNPEGNIEAVIVGGGPVGLFMAICLLKRGISCRVIEKREKPVPDSRSLGIHPVSLELFDELGIAEPFLQKGLKIKKGIAHTGKKKLGEISFENCPTPHNYILACPQFATEKILRDELLKLDSHSLITEATFTGFEETDELVNVNYSKNGGKKQLACEWLIGCDGKKSEVRRQSSIHFSGKRYNDTYVMGDFEDTTDFGTEAAVFLPKEGMIECFPLPNGMRRWVIKTDSYIPNPTRKILADLVKIRLGYDLYDIESTMLSSFGVQHFMAETFSKGRVILAGDAAHVVSPIGGQGMNLGWLDCLEIAHIMADIEDGSKNMASPFVQYSNKQKKITKQVARRAEINMRLGRKQPTPFLRNIFIRAVLKSPLKNKVAELFTMRGLGAWWI